MTLEDFKARFEQMKKADNLMLEIGERNMNMIINENYRVAKLASNSEEILNELDLEFKKQTGLNSTDITLLMLATGLQMARQYLLSNDKYRITSNQGDHLVKDPLKKLFPSTSEIITGKVPYDAVATSDLFKYSTELSGATHRYRTLGHDPILGWIIGPANIMTSSLTKYDFDTFSVSNGVIQRRYRLNFPGMMNDFINLSINYPDRLALSIVKQAIHFGSDYFTKQGLPLPFISTLDNDLAKNMVLKGKIDTYSVSRGASISVLINYIIKIIHKLFYNPNRDDERLYEIKTRKIIMYSNLIATSSNLAVVAAAKNLKYLDVGGACVTIYRLITDKNFISKMKREFVYGEFNKMIKGNDLELLNYSYEELLEKSSI